MEIPKPNFLIIGSAKCGTTALASILASHPDCCFSQPKEISFFQDTINFKPNQNYSKGWEWYKQFFSHYSGEKMIGEATPSYADRSRSPDTASRIYDFNPNMKIIYMVRNPLERQISAWKMFYAFYLEKRFEGREIQWASQGFNSWMMNQKGVAQWDECKYNYQIEAYKKYFSQENIHVSFLEDWINDKSVEIKKILNFLELQGDGWDEKINEDANKTSDRTILNHRFASIHQSKMVNKLYQHFPSSVKQKIRSKLLRKRVIVPRAHLSDKLKQEFFNYLKEDMDEFLLTNNKPIDFWN